MKYKLISIAYALLLGGACLTSCNEQDELLQVATTDKASNHAVIDGNIGSRIALTDDAENRVVKVDWKEGDAFSIKVNGTDYTFVYNASNDEFECSDANFPTTFTEAGSVTATYPATAPSTYANQPGTLEGAAAQLTLTATFGVTAGQSTEGLNLVFKHQSAILKLTATCNEFAGEQVNVTFSAAGLHSNGGSTITTSSPITIDDDGTATFYFAVLPGTTTVSDATLTLSTSTVGYSATMTDAKLLEVGKLYNINKTLTDKAFEVKTENEKTTYEVNNAAGLQAWADATKSDLTTNLKLMNDINLPAVADGQSNWTPIGTYSYNDYTNAFKGTIDGNGKTITGMRINAKSAGQGFVAMLGNGGVIKNLTFAEANMKANQYSTGIIAGDMKEGTIENCVVDAFSSLTSTSYWVGGIVGFGTGTITNCINRANITGTNRVAGIAACFSGIISGCTNEGAITGTDSYNYIGGILAMENSTHLTIQNCINSGRITGKNMYLGGIAGYVFSSIPGTTTIIGCTNTGEINNTGTGEGRSAAGIVGFIDFNNGTCNIYGCINRGAITAKYYVGGIVSLVKNGEPYMVACGNESTSLAATGTGPLIGGIAATTNNAANIIGSWTAGDSDTKIHGYGSGNTTNSFVFTDNTSAITTDKVTEMNNAIATNKSDCTYRWQWTSGSWPTLITNQ